MVQTKLLTIRQFGERIHRSPRTVDRFYARGTPGLPEIIWMNSLRYVTEDQAESFLKEIIKHGALPGQERGDHRPKSAGGRKPSERKAETA